MEKKNLRAGCILLIMNNLDQANAITGKLNGYGYSNIDICLNRKTFDVKLDKIVPEVIICEPQSEEDLGIIKKYQLIRDKHDIPVIYISEPQDERSFQTIMETHPHALLRRPLNWNELRVAIESAWTQRGNSNVPEKNVERFNQQFQNVDIPFQVLDTQGNLISVNRAWTELTGYKANEVTKKWFGDLLVQESRKLFKQNLTTIQKEGIIRDQEYTLLKKDSHEVTVSLTCLLNIANIGEVNKISCIIKDTTSTNELKMQLRESEERFRMLFEEAPLPYQSLSEDGSIVYVNQAWCNLLGYGIKEAIGMNFRNLLALEDQEKFIEYFPKFKLKGEVYCIKYKMVTKLGGEILVSINGKVHYDDKGIFLRSHCILQDITKQKQLEQLLNDQLTFSEAITSCPQLLIYVYDIELKKNIWVSNAHRDLISNTLKLDPAEADQKTIYNIAHPDDLSIIQSAHEELINSRDKHVVEVEYRMKLSGDQWGYFRDSVSVFKRDEKGKVFQILGILTDITEMKATQDTLKKKEREIGVITDNIPALVSYVDKNGRYRYVNRHYEDWFGIPQKDFIGKHYSEFYGKEASKLIGDFSKIALSGQEVSEDSFVPNRLCGDRYVSFHNIPNVDEKGQVEGFYTLITDITDRQKAYLDLRESEVKYRSLVESMDDMVFNVDRNGCILAAGGKTLEGCGLDPNWTKGKNLNDLFDKQIFTKETNQKVFDEGSSINFELSLTFNGYGKIFSITSFPIKNVEGEVINAGVICHDQTALKQSESALQKTEQWLYTVLNNAPISIYATDNQGIFTLHEGKKVEEIGMKPGENVGISAFDLYGSLPWEEHDGTITNGNDVLRRVLKGEKITGITELNGTLFDNQLVPIYGKDMKITGTVGVAIDITEQKKLEQELKITLEKYRCVFETFPIGITITDNSGQILEVNLESEKILGVTRKEHRKRRFNGKEWQIVRSDGTPMPSDEYASVRALQENRRVTDVEMGIVKGENKITWINVTAAPIPLEDFGVMIAYHDITSKKAAEEALMESERRYKDLVDKAGIAITTDNTEGRITFFNHAFARLFGYTMKEIHKQSRETLIHPEDLQKLVSYHEKRIRGEKVPESYEFRGIHKKGNEIWMEVKLTILKQGDKIIGTRNYLWDITERKNMVQDLIYNETRFRELFNHMSSGVAVYEYDPGNKDFVFKDINKAGMVISQIKHKKDVLNKSLLECFPGAKKLGLWDALKRVNQSCRSEIISNTQYSDNRVNLYVENSVYKLPSGELVAVFDDIYDRVLAEKSLKQSYEQIQKLSQHLEKIREEERKYIAGELHDELGQILTAIKMDVSWIRNKTKTDSSGIKKRTLSTIQIIDEAISKVQQLSMELRPRMLDDFGLLETLRAHIEDIMRRTDIVIKYQIPKQEPEVIPEQEISIFRIIQEALNNALRHSGASEIILDLLEKNNNLLMKINDNGVGIPKEDISSTDSLGIMIMRDRVTQWNGKLEITGIPGKGTTVKVEIPLQNNQTAKSMEVTSSV